MDTIKSLSNAVKVTSVHDSSRFRVGTLVYTRASLIRLFVWLLWGDFTYTLMQCVVPSLLPLLLRENGASNIAIGFVVSSIFMILSTVACPIISYKSDRFRSRWGRRRPFILVTTPLVVLFLSLIPFSPEIARAMAGVGWISSLLKFSPIGVVLLVSGVLVAAFQIFNLFVSSVYYYLIPDVVPEAFIGRFYSLFRACGIAAGVVFNYWILGLAAAHMHEIFVGMALFYGVAITVMCLKVKEGEYPAPDASEERAHWWSGIRNYAVECFGNSFYLRVFLVYSLFQWAAASDVFNLFYYRENLGMTLDQIGKFLAYVSILSVVVIYPIGVMIDRWGSQKSLIAGMFGTAILRFSAFFVVQDYGSLVLIALINTLPTVICQIAIMKWLIDLYPRERYGQFGSAGAMVAALGSVVMGPICGVLVDRFGDYKYVWLWPVAFNLFGAWVALIIYRKWKAMGGAAGYRAP